LACSVRRIPLCTLERLLRSIVDASIRTSRLVRSFRAEGVRILANGVSVVLRAPVGRLPLVRHRGAILHRVSGDVVVAVAPAFPLHRGVEEEVARRIGVRVYSSIFVVVGLAKLTLTLRTFR